MITPEQGRRLRGSDVHYEGAGRLGTVKQVLIDDATGRPEWARVSVGLLGRDRLVPLSVSWVDDEGRLAVPLDEHAVKHAPEVGAEDGALSAEDEDRLYQHYGLTPGAPTTASAGDASFRPPGADSATEDAPLHHSLDADRRTGATPLPDPEGT